MNNIGNAVASQLVWLLAVGGAARGYGWAGPVAVCVFAALQMYAHKQILTHYTVIPSRAGIHFDVGSAATAKIKMDSSLRWKDGHSKFPGYAICNDFWAVTACISIGFACDSLFAATGLVRYASPGPWPQLAPLWIVALWASLGLTLHHSLSFLQTRLWLAALLGAIAAPLSYYAAARAWGAIELAQPISLTLGLLAITWAIVVPLLVFIARRQQSALRLHHMQPSEFSS